MTFQPALSYDHLAVADAVSSLGGASKLLTRAVLRLDDGGLFCESLTDISAEASALVAVWAGRPVPHEADDVPAYVVAAAIEWRREKKRGY